MNIFFLTLIHFSAFYAVTLFPLAKWETICFAIFLWPLSCLGITAGVHRLWAHRSYQATFSYRLLLMLMNSVANQGSIYRWARDHRLHHKYSETSCDPHNAKRGLFFSHIGWLFLKKNSQVLNAGKKIDCSDLLADPIVMFQHRYDPWFSQICCFGVPTVIGMYFWQENLKNVFFICGIFRYVCTLHFTWLVNSVAHLYGNRPYDKTISPAENWFVSIFSIGEGWHNWHHRYPYDYAASEFGIHKQFNPTKAWIDFFAKLGMVSKRKRALGAWKKQKERFESLNRTPFVVN
jgi:stearoyl-CoA desaturase (delta-9 desaturase)